MLNLTIALDGIVSSHRPPPYPTCAAPFGAAFFLLRDLRAELPRTRNADPGAQQRRGRRRCCRRHEEEYD